ncbi:Uncharacterised protein [Mycobacterium tuberculosis]|uniref:Uncharacterized protein n=1 Tax=Mycobacterium tuberculosis TaxID=1773 RepID=A0A916LGL2_MYCTX|nr:Uncharacterised protein [Mycobacterium tuberculosis]
MYAVSPTPMPNALPPKLSRAGSTKSVTVSQPTRCKATITANIRPRRHHSAAVRARFILADRDLCLSSWLLAMSVLPARGRTRCPDCR